MPTYELSLIVKHALQRPDLVSAVKRVGTNIIESGGYIRKLEFVGNRALPQRSRANNEWHTRGNYFIFKVDLPDIELPKLHDLAARDQQVIMHNFVGLAPEKEAVCTLDDELKPPSERKSVQDMIEIGRRRPRLERPYNKKTGLGFYPMWR